MLFKLKIQQCSLSSRSHKLATIRVFKTDVFQALALRQIENKNVPQ